MACQNPDTNGPSLSPNYGNQQAQIIFVMLFVLLAMKAPAGVERFRTDGKQGSDWVRDNDLHRNVCPCNSHMGIIMGMG